MSAREHGSPLPVDARVRPRARVSAEAGFDVLLLVLVTVAGLAVRLWDLESESFWLDEAGRAAIAALPLLQIPDAVSVVELSPPLYHLLLHGWIQVVGSGDGAVRLLSVLLSTAAIPTTYALARALVGRRPALVASVLASASPLYITYGRETAMYALFALLGLVATLGYVGFSRDPGRRTLGLYTGATLLSLYTHYYALFLVAAQNSHVLWLWSRGKLTRRQARAWAASQAFLALAFLPWLPVLARQGKIAAEVSDWTAPDPIAALGALAVALSVGTATVWPTLLVVGAFLPAVLLGVVRLRKCSTTLALLSCYALVPTLLVLLAAYPLHAFRERGFIAIAWVPQVIVAVGLVYLVRAGGRATRRAPLRGDLAVRLAGALYGCVLVVLLVAGARAQLLEAKEDWRGAAALISAVGRQGDVVYVVHYGGLLALDRYLGTPLPRRGLPADFDWQRGYTARYRVLAADLGVSLDTALGGYQRLWVVLSHADGRGDQLLLDYLDQRYAAMLRQDFLGVRVRLWSLATGTTRIALPPVAP